MVDEPLSQEPDDDSFLLPWATFSDHAVFDNVEDLTRFRLLLQFPRFLSWRDPAAMVGYQDVLYESLYEIIGHARYFGFDELERVRDPSSVGVRYRDADYGFSVTFSQESVLELTRDGSSLESFYDWYGRVMPHFVDLVSAVRTRLQNEASTDHRRLTIDPARGMYTFNFIFHDFRDPSAQRGGAPVKNSRVLRSALTHIPGTTGALVELTDDELPDLGRIDLKVSRLHPSPCGLVREVYDVEAPGNRDYSTLWFSCSYIAETRLDSDVTREPPDFDVFISRYEYPLLEFVRQRALVHFLSGITKGLRFRSTSGRLP